MNPQDYLFNRVFDVAFAVTGIVLFEPLWMIALVINLGDSRQTFYRQDPTAEFGQRYEVYKFQTMRPEGKSPKPISGEENDRINRVGRILRQKHLDVSLQLLSMLAATMSVVGPRVVWKGKETVLEPETNLWCQRWFVKPGLTRSAQIRGLLVGIPRRSCI